MQYLQGPALGSPRLEDMATIYDIARETGLSAATVSRALQGSRLIGEEVRARVEASASALGYVPRTVRRPRSRAILHVRLVLPKPANPARSLFYDVTELIEGLRAGFGKSSVNLVCDLARTGFDPFPNKKGGDTDAFVFAFHRPDESTVERLRGAQVPFVVLNRSIPGLPCLGLDQADGIRALLVHLSAGIPRLRPVFVSVDRLGEIHDERSRAFLENAAAMALDLPSHPTRVFPNLDAIDSKAIAGLAAEANAIVAVNDIIGMIVLEEARGLGHKVPETLAITGFDDSPLRRLSRPLLTTFSLPVRELAQAAGRRLAAEILDREPVRPSALLRGKLLQGGTTRRI
jgi:LacI family transcriptional regulator